MIRPRVLTTRSDDCWLSEPMTMKMIQPAANAPDEKVAGRMSLPILSFLIAVKREYIKKMPKKALQNG